MWTGENDSNTLPLDAYFFEMGLEEKNLRFQKVFGQVWTGSHWQQTQSYTRRICPFHFFNFFFEFENNKKFQWANQTAVRVCAIIMNPPLIASPICKSGPGSVQSWVSAKFEISRKS